MFRVRLEAKVAARLENLQTNRADKDSGRTQPPKGKIKLFCPKHWIILKIVYFFYTSQKSLLLKTLEITVAIIEFISVRGKMQAEGLDKAVSLDLGKPQGAQVVRPRVAWGL